MFYSNKRWAGYLALAKNINKNGFDNLLHAIEQSTYKLKQNQL